MQEENIIQLVKNSLRYHNSIGVEGYKMSSEIDAFLKRPVIATAHELPVENELQPKKVSKPNAAVLESTKKVPVVKISDIAEDIRVCKGCELIAERMYPVIGNGGTTSKLLIVGDWYRTAQGENHVSSGVLGREEDLMLFRMMKAIKLKESEYFVTNVIKCATPVATQPNANCVKICSSFLHREITALQPDVICTMGMISTKTLLNSSDSLSRLRGKFHQFSTVDGRKIPLIPTYHPNYLLQNPEMKQATWADLQSLAKHMGLPVT